MKAKLLQSTVLWTFLSVATLLVGCSDDEDYRDVDGQSPTLELTSDHIRTLTGYEFKIAGKIVDKDGIRSINLQCAELYLDKTIELSTLYSESLYEYNLASTFTASTPLTFPRLLIAACSDAASSVFPAAFAASSCC